MKKLILLLIPALLFTTSCTPKGSSSSLSSEEPSSSELPSSSSEEPIVWPDMYDVFNTLVSGSYELSIKNRSYYDGYLVEETVTKIQNDHNKACLLQQFSNEEGEYFEPTGYAELVDDEYYSYHSVNEYWLQTSGLSKVMLSVYSILDTLEQMVLDTQVQEQAAWTFDEKKGLYSGESEYEEIKYTYSIQLTEEFFSKIRLVGVNEETYAKFEIIVRASNVGTTTVDIPETEATSLYNTLYTIGEAFMTLDSYDMVQRVTDTKTGEANQNTYRVVHYRETATTIVYFKDFNSSEYFFRDVEDEFGNHTYSRKDAEGDNWQEITDSYYARVTYIPLHFVIENTMIDSQDLLASVLDEILSVMDAAVQYRLNTEIQESSVYFELKFEQETHYITRFVVEAENSITENTIYNHNTASF